MMVIKTCKSYTSVHYNSKPLRANIQDKNHSLKESEWVVM